MIATITERQAQDSAKTDRPRFLVFSQWTSLLDFCEVRLGQAGISWSRLDGQTQNREHIVSTFQDEQGPDVLLISLKAGGVGLNLTRADHVFILDPWWNPAGEDQAADRAHRIGQERPVLIQRLVAIDTVEEGVMALKKTKSALAGSIIDDGHQESKLTRDDLLNLIG
jgi:SNF2 family DNA or RNA helicase